VSDYIPYEERIRDEKRRREDAADAAADAHRASVAKVAGLLARLGGGSADCYLEILWPAKGLRRHFSNKTIVTRSGLLGGPHFVIDEVLSAYSIDAGIVEPLRKEMGSLTYNAYVVPDGRVWSFAGRGETENTYQLLGSSARRLPELTIDDLEQIAAGLKRHLDVSTT
jgi:hypothetical protein